jgi:hypothetical protein
MTPHVPVQNVAHKMTIVLLLRVQQVTLSIHKHHLVAVGRRNVPRANVAYYNHQNRRSRQNHPRISRKKRKQIYIFQALHLLPLKMMKEKITRKKIPIFPNIPNMIIGHRQNLLQIFKPIICFLIEQIIKNGG